ncbi:MAG: hypothetical protein NZ811_01960 [Gammaproteobacteria bacterium]|nr:hypothetical protein [Gammaproteobacteria bacterium]
MKKQQVTKQMNLKLPKDVIASLDLKASKMGLNRTSYIKLIAMMDVEFQLVGSPNITSTQ